MEALIGFSLVLLIVLLVPALFELFRYCYIVVPEIRARELVLDDELYCKCKEPDWECDDSMGYRLRCKKCGKEPGNE